MNLPVLEENLEYLEAYHQTYVGVAELPTVKEYFLIKSLKVHIKVKMHTKLKMHIKVTVQSLQRF